MVNFEAVPSSYLPTKLARVCVQTNLILLYNMGMGIAYRFQTWPGQISISQFLEKPSSVEYFPLCSVCLKWFCTRMSTARTLINELKWHFVVNLSHWYSLVWHYKIQLWTFMFYLPTETTDSSFRGPLRPSPTLASEEPLVQHATWREEGSLCHIDLQDCVAANGWHSIRWEILIAWLQPFQRPLSYWGPTALCTCRLWEKRRYVCGVSRPQSPRQALYNDTGWGPSAQS